MQVVNNNIYIANNLLSKKKLFSDLLPGQKILVVTDKHVGKIYLHKLQQTLADFILDVVTLECGDHNKTWSAVEQILQRLTKNHDRSSVVLSLGGGVVCDLSGFAASIFMRGISVIHIPTTLMAQVDAAIGAKTGCNFAGVKNYIGTFYEPLAVLMDISTLLTQNKREYRAGLAEVVKYGFIYDAELFCWLEENITSLLNMDLHALQYLVVRCSKIKVEIVANDKYDKGLRQLLNFGHTFGHAIEAVGNFSGYLHGEAVAIGMLLATRLAVKLDMLDNAIYARLVSLLACFNLLFELDWAIYTPKLLFNYIMYDKKKMHGSLNLVLPCGLGKGKIISSLKFATVEDFTKLCLSDFMIATGDTV